MIREATFQDMPALRKLLSEGYRYLKNTGTVPNVVKAEYQLSQYIVHADRFSMVSDKATSILFGHVMPPWYSNIPEAQDLLFYSPGKEGFYLLKAFIRWAKARGAVQIEIKNMSGISPYYTEMFFEKFGLERVGTVHRRIL